MQPVQEEPEWCSEAAERSGVVRPPTQPLHSGWRPSPTWAGLPRDTHFLAEGPWPAAAPDCTYPGYYYEGSAGPVSEQSLEPEAVTEPAKPSSPECLSFVLGVAFAALLLGIGLLVIHSSLSPHDITPDIGEDVLERRLEVAPNTVGQRLIPRGVVLPDVDERGNRKTTNRKRRVQVAGRTANDGGASRPRLTTAKASPETTTLAVTVASTRVEDDAQPRGASTDDSCRRHVYTHCVRPRPEFYYSAERRACVPAAADTVHVCNRGSNRFASFESCLASCANGRRMSDRCYESTLFFPCAQQDVLDVPWYFDGKNCVAWSFPQGTCLPMGRRGVFRSFEECRRRCVLRTEPECDETPPAEACSPRQLRHPYFADMQARGGARCVNASRRTLQSRRCLIGSNQFASLEACRKACVRN
ncbi:uncharacterized protein [Dermacentor andersoni]|uniref:uncharacterized protein n=1 Tax=Dermacentor andersoni TaxID=34620 RepID=UPI0021559BB5|nr:uncharacterized protein LOC126548639 [Dermacentor andersoni]